MEMAAEVKRRHPFGSILFPFTFMALVIQPFSESQKTTWMEMFSFLLIACIPTPASGEASRTLK